MAFHLGSLGFLTPFEFVNFEEQMINVLEGKLIGWTFFSKKKKLKKKKKNIRLNRFIINNNKIHN